MNMLLWDLFKVDTQETTEDILKVMHAIMFLRLLFEEFVSGYSIAKIKSQHLYSDAYSK